MPRYRDEDEEYDEEPPPPRRLAPSTRLVVVGCIVVSVVAVAGLLVMVVVVLPRIRAVVASRPGGPALAAPDHVRDVSSLDREFEGNEIAADAKYLNKVIEFEDPVVRVWKADDGRYWLAFSGQANRTPTAHCSLHPSAVKEAASLQPEQRVHMKGICRGAQRTRETLTGYRVFLEDCIFVAKE